jgi:hypothetical protein
MQDGIFISEPAEKRGIQDRLFNPFRYVAGVASLVLGLAAILVSGVVCYFAQVHFDGVLDVHFIDSAPLWFFLAEGLIAWLCMALVLQIFGAMLAPARFRFVDMLGTQALARWPYLFIALVSLPPGFERMIQYLTEKALKTPPSVTVTVADGAVTVLGLSVIFAATVWTVLLMYRGYAVSTGIKEMRKKTLSFIVALIIAEVVCKVIFIIMAVKTGALPSTR